MLDHRLHRKRKHMHVRLYDTSIQILPVLVTN